MNSFPDKFTPFAADCRLKVSKYNNCITFVPEHIISSENVENAQKVWCLLDMCRRDESVLFSFYRCCLLSGELWRTQGCFGLRGVVFKWHHFQGDGGWTTIYGSNNEDPPFKYSCQIMIKCKQQWHFSLFANQIILKIAFSIAVINGRSLRACCVVVCMTQILHVAAWRPKLESPTQGPAKTRQPPDTELLVLSS